jgi:hypothetical protein
MKAPVWIALFQRIPASYHDCLAVKLASGAEVVLQTILSLEEEYMVVRGRTSGSTEEGRVFLVPYDQMQYLGFNRKMSEEEVRGLFGGQPAAVAPSIPAPVEVSAPQPPPAAAVEAPPAEAPAAEPPKKPAAISKTILLARLRARLAQDSKPAGT